MSSFYLKKKEHAGPGLCDRDVYVPSLIFFQLYGFLDNLRKELEVVLARRYPVEHDGANISAICSIVRFFRHPYFLLQLYKKVGFRKSINRNLESMASSTPVKVVFVHKMKSQIDVNKLFLQKMALCESIVQFTEAVARLGVSLERSCADLVAHKPTSSDSLNLPPGVFEVVINAQIRCDHTETHTLNELQRVRRLSCSSRGSRLVFGLHRELLYKARIKVCTKQMMHFSHIWGDVVFEAPLREGLIRKVWSSSTLDLVK